MPWFCLPEINFSFTWWPFTLLNEQVLFSFYLDFNDHMKYCLDFFFLGDCDYLIRTNWTANSNAVVCQNTFLSWAEKNTWHSRGWRRQSGSSLFGVRPVCFNSCKLIAPCPCRCLSMSFYQPTINTIMRFINGQMK